MLLTVYQGRNVYNKTSQFFTTDKEWARNFTQSGQDSEIRIGKIDPKVIYQREPLPEATNEEQIDVALKEAKAAGYKAIWVNEGRNEPPGILVIDMNVVRIYKQSMIRESHEDTPIQKEAEKLKNELKAKYQELEGLFFYVSWSGILNLSELRVKKEFRGRGIGSAVMEEIVKFADKNKLTIVLSPEPEPKYKAKLDLFYKKFGFVNNKGRNKDYKLSSAFAKTMYRRPKTLNEGAILFNKEDKKDIYNYLNKMELYSKSIFKIVDKYGYEKNRFVDEEEVVNLLQKQSDELSKQFNFKIKYYFKNKSDVKGFYNEVTNTIGINLFLHSDMTIWRNGGYRVFKIYNIHFKSIKLTFFHEVVHYIQTTLRKEKIGNNYTVPSDWSKKDKYMKRPWEQQAHAIAYLEKLKQELNTKNPKLILTKLKKLGLVKQDALHDLKLSDYKSWKSIMKQVIMSIVADIKEKK